VVVWVGVGWWVGGSLGGGGLRGWQIVSGWRDKLPCESSKE